MEGECIYDDSMKTFMERVVREGCAGAMDNTQFLENEDLLARRVGKGYDVMRTGATEALDFHEPGLEATCFPECIVVGKTLFQLKGLDPRLKEVPDVIAMVKETFHIKEIWLKRQRKWLTTGMAVICDSSGTEMEAMFWGKQCKHLLFISTGCLLHLRNLTLGEYQKRTVVKVLKDCKLSNLGHISSIRGDAIKDHINILAECQKLKEYYPRFCTKLACMTEAKHEIQFSNLEPGTMTHIRAKVVALSRHGSDIHSDQPLRITVSTEVTSHAVFLFLHGSSKLWRKRLILLQTKIWEFFYLACCTSAESDSIELHTTVISQARALFDEDGDCRTEIPTCPEDKIISFEELLNSTQVQVEGKLQLTGIVAESVLCYIGIKQFLLTESSPKHLLKRILERCSKLCENVRVELSAKCHFQNDPAKRPICLRVLPHKLKNLDLPLLFSKLFTDEEDVRIICEVESLEQNVDKETLLLNLVDVR